VILATSIYGIILAQLATLLAPTQGMAVTLFFIFLGVQFELSGFVVRLPSLHPFLGVWMSKLSFSRWAYEALILNEIHHNSSLDFRGFSAPELRKRYAELGHDASMVLVDQLGLGYDKKAAFTRLLICILITAMMCYIPLRGISFEKR